LNKKLFLIPVIFLLVLTSVLATATAPDPAGTIAYWTLENLLDSTDNNYDLTNNGDPSIVAGILDDAYSFDGTNDYLTIASSSLIEQSELSVSIWVYITGGVGTRRGIIESYGNDDWFALSIEASTDNQLKCFYRSSSSTTVTMEYSPTITLNSWYHIVFTRSSSGGKFYINNVLVDSDNTAPVSSFDLDGIRIGTYRGANDRWFNGIIDEIAIFDTILTIDEIDYLYNFGFPTGLQQWDFTSDESSGNHSLETNVLLQQPVPVQVNSNTYQLVGSGSFTPVNSSNATIGGVVEVTSTKALDMQCKILIDGVDYGTESNRSFDFASTGNMYITSSEFEVEQNVPTSVGIWCRRTSVNGKFTIDKGISIIHLLVDANGNTINNRFIDDDFSLTSSSYTLLANTTFNTSNLSAEGLSRQIVFDGEIGYNYVSDGTISLYSVVNGVSSSVFNRYGSSGSSGNGGNFNIAYNLSNETSVPILIYGKSSSSDGSVNVKLTMKEMIGSIGEFNSTGLSGTSLTSTIWATAKTLKINNSEHVTGDLIVKASVPTISTSGEQIVTYRLYYNGSAYSPGYERTIVNDGAGVSVLQYLFTDIGTGLFDVELQYKVESSASIIGGSLITYLSGNIEPIPNIFFVNASNLWDNTSITDFNVTVNGGGTFFESNSSGVAIVTAVNPSNLTIASSDYISRVYLDHNTSNNLEAELYKSIMWVNITERFSGNPISDWALYNGSRVLINTTSYIDVFYPNPGEFVSLVLHSNVGAFSDRNLDGFNVSLLEENTIYYELLPTEMSVTAKNILSDVSIQNFSVTYSSLNSSHYGSYSCTDGDIIFGVINGNTYNITIDADGYALYNNSINKVISGNSDHAFSLYTNNSINFEVRWESDNSLVTNLTSITLAGTPASYSFNTSNGTSYKDNIIDGIYSVRASINGLDKYYSVTVADRSHQDLTIYFAEDYSNVTFLFQDENTGTTIEGVYFSLSRYVNGSLAVVSSKLSDITGTVKAKYVEGVYYSISSSRPGYSVKSFVLDPIESELYIVKMESSASEVFIGDGVSAYYFHSPFTNGSNNFSFTINSPLGLLSSYWLNVSYPGGFSDYSGTQSIGEVFDFDFNITNPDMFDTVMVQYYYSTSLSGSDTKTFYHPINFVNASDGSWGNMDADFSGLGIFERIILVVLVVILVAGFAYLIAGFGGSLIMGLLVYVFFAATGFIPLWTILIPLLFGGVLIFRGGILG